MIPFNNTFVLKIHVKLLFYHVPMARLFKNEYILHHTVDINSHLSDLAVTKLTNLLQNSYVNLIYY